MLGRLGEWKRRTFREGVRRRLRRESNRIFRRTSERRLAQAIRQLGIPDGAPVFVHAKLSSFGYLPCGPEGVIHAIRSAVPGCTILMPSFPFAGTLRDYARSGAVFDPATTPSRSGLLSEVFRTMPGVVRSRHPSHPCCALGPQADALLDGTEHARTAFSDDSVFGRFHAAENATQLQLDTNTMSIVHRIQELERMPNLFLPDLEEMRTRNPDGSVETFRYPVFTDVMHWVAVGTRPDDLQYVWAPDYSLHFPSAHRDRVLARLRDPEVRRGFAEREERFERDGVIRRSRVREAEILAIRLAPWVDAIRAQMRRDLDRFPDAYDPETVRAAVRKTT